MSLAEFWAERHLCSVTTIRADGTPHVVPVGATYDPATNTARIITSGKSQKVRNIANNAYIAICQIDGRRWSTLEGTAVIDTDRPVVADAERRYAARYKLPRPNPARVVIIVTVSRVLGTYGAGGQLGGGLSGHESSRGGGPGTGGPDTGGADTAGAATGGADTGGAATG
jgi:PPOX class probable F420-dependent enzyme